jgi:WD40 repeat protein
MAHTREKAWAKALCFSPDGKQLAVALVPDNHSPSEVVLWNLETNKFQASHSDCKEDVKKLAFTPDGSVVILMPSSVRVWDPKTNKVRREFKGANPAEQFVTTTVSSDGQTLATMCRDNKVRLWRVADGASQKNWSVNLDLIRLEGCAFAFSPDGKYLAMRGQGTRFHVWNAQTGKELRLARGGNDFENIDVMTFSPDGRLLAFHGNYGPRIFEVAALLAGN